MPRSEQLKEIREQVRKKLVGTPLEDKISPVIINQVVGSVMARIEVRKHHPS